jgi:hypothetical protein
MKRSTSTLAAVLIFIGGVHVAKSDSPPKELNDALLDNLVGDWRVDRKFGNGRTAEDTLHAEWALQHHFVELHYGGAASSSKYEAKVFIGYDDSDQSYVCHWIDVFGGRYSGLGRGKIDNDKRTIEFRFDSKEGALTNKFAFDPQTKTWTSLIRQQENGAWKVFAEEKFTRTERKK